MLNRGNGWVSPDGIGPGHITYSVKGVGAGLLNAIMSWTWEVEQREVASGDCALVWGERL